MGLGVGCSYGKNGSTRLGKRKTRVRNNRTAARRVCGARTGAGRQGSSPRGAEAKGPGGRCVRAMIAVATGGALASLLSSGLAGIEPGPC